MKRLFIALWLSVAATLAGAASTVTSLPAFIQDGTGAVSRTLPARAKDWATVKDFGAIGNGIADDTAAIQAAITAKKSVYFPAGTYKVTAEITIGSDTHLVSDAGAVILGAIVAPPATYQPIFKVAGPVSNIAIEGMKCKTTEPAVSLVDFAYLVTDLRVVGNESEGCSLVRAFAGVRNALIQGNYIHSPAHEGAFNDYGRAVLLSSAWGGSDSYNLRVADNIILGSWTHGIEVFGGTVMDATDPATLKKIRGVVVSGNVVRAADSTHSRGGIWFSQVEDVTVSSNVVELYGDVGIDFEACKNAVAVGNSLRNNNKNLAMYGNNRNVRFSQNVAYNNVPGLAQFYAKPANNNDAGYQVDARNTDIVLDGNTFHSDVTVTGFETLDLGSGGRVSVLNNILVNTTISANKFSLTEVEIRGNSITHNDAAVGMTPIHIQQAYASGDATATTFKARIIGNRIEHSNPAGTAFAILWQSGNTVGASVDFDYYLDIRDNEIRIDTDQYALYVQAGATEITGTKYLHATVEGNKAWGRVNFDLSGARVVNRTVRGNAGMAGAPLATAYTTTGTLNPWDVSYLNVGGVASFTSLPDGDYNGQQKHIVMTGAGNTGTVIIGRHRLGINQNAVCSAVGQFALLQCNAGAWDTVKATCAGI